MSLVVGAYQDVSLVVIQAVTPLHIGSGRAIGTVDLPVQRDSFGYPVIPPSSLKGPMRARLVVKKALKLLNDGKVNSLGDAIKEANNNDPDVKAFFGPPSEIRRPEEALAGAVAVLEAKLLAIPVRSLRGVWTYVTTPQLLRYLKNYVELYRGIGSQPQPEPKKEQKESEQGGSEGSKEESKKSKSDELYGVLDSLLNELNKRSKELEEGVAYTTTDVINRLAVERLEGGQSQAQGSVGRAVKEGGKEAEQKEAYAVFNEEFRLRLNSDIGEWIQRFINILSGEVGPQEKQEAGKTDILVPYLKEVGLVIVGDVIGREIIERSIMRQARVRLTYGMKVVEEGPWTEENVPEFTLFTTLFLYSPTRYLLAKGRTDVKNDFKKEMGLGQGSSYLIIGGHETIGRGIVKLIEVPL